MKLEIALYPFCGHTFTSSYEYADLTVGRRYSSLKSECTISFNIKNVGTNEGIEVAQLVFHDQVNQDLTTKRLSGFSKVSLKPGESKKIKFVFDPAEHINKSSADNRVLEIVAGKLKRKFSLLT
jgi:beta-glucosidase